MSEAEKSIEIEDVLSSIRRLVADRSPVTPEPAKPVEVEATLPQPEATPETEDKPASFVEKMNASIAEITQQADEIVDDKTALDAQMPADQPDAVLANEPQEPAEPVVVETKKPEPLILRADMAADLKTPEKPSETATDAVLEIEDKPKAVFQEIPEVDAEEIVMPDDIEEDEVTLESEAEASIATDSQIIDADILREIVGEMVRAELQGDLGDRITRNVRKLVRREIHHALATRDFE